MKTETANLLTIEEIERIKVLRNEATPGRWLHTEHPGRCCADVELTVTLVNAVPAILAAAKIVAGGYARHKEGCVGGCKSCQSGKWCGMYHEHSLNCTCGLSALMGGE